MAFVKLDCDMIRSTIWFDRPAREAFITALLLAEPYEITEPTETIEVRSLNHTDFVIPPGWYGFVPAAGSGIVRLAGMEIEEGLSALERLAAPDPESRTPDHDGRRLVRVDGGYIVLNFDKHRKRDHGNAARCARYRERLAKEEEETRMLPVSTCHVNMQAEAEGIKNTTKEEDGDRAKVILRIMGMPKYSKIDIHTEYDSCRNWYKNKRKTFTQKAFISWLDRVVDAGVIVDDGGKVKKPLDRNVVTDY